MALFETIGLIQIGTWLVTKIADKGFDTIYGKFSPDEITKKFYECVEAASKTIQNKYPDVLGSNVEYFFKQDKVINELIKLLFKKSKVDVDSVSIFFDTTKLPANFIVDFINELKLELQKDIQFDKILSDNEIYIAIQGLDINVLQIANNSSLTLDEIRTIKSILENRLGSTFSFQDFFTNYKKNALNNLTQVNFIGLSIDSSIKKKRKKLEDVFVRPKFTTKDQANLATSTTDDEFSLDIYDDDEIEFNRLFDKRNHLVILGDPGSGKSVLVKYIIISILNKSSNEFNDTKITSTIPFRIELRKYLAFKKLKGGNISRYLCFLLEDEYGIEGITEQTVNKIFKEYYCSIFFDGLDEIFKVEDKISIKNDIENFHNSYPNIKSLTTSRKIGYDEAKLNENSFEILNIKSFDDNQIEDYVKKWYVKEESNISIKDREVQGFLDKRNQLDSELTSNPLLLSLIVILYRNTLKLPESKLEIYQSCTKTLVDKWDSSKELEIHLDQQVYTNKEKILADLAYWQYLELSADDVNLTYEKSRKTVSNTIKDKLKIADEFNCLDRAEEFMLYAQKRSIYFDNNFTHKTFLEYYTAYWIYSNIEKKHKIDERNSLIKKFIGNSFWHIVIELLLNMIDKDQADNEIMDDLIHYQMSQSTNSLPFLLTTILNYKNVSQNTIRDLILETVKKLVEIGPDRYKQTQTNNKEWKEEEYNINPETKLFSALSSILSSNETLTSIFISCLKEMEKTYTEDEVKYIYTIYLELEFLTRSYPESKDNFPFDKTKYDKVIDNHPYLYRINPANNYSRSYNTEFIISYIRKFGIENVFIGHNSVYAGYMLISSIEIFIMYLVSNKMKDYYNSLKELEKAGLKNVDILNYVIRVNRPLILSTRNIDPNEAILNLFDKKEDVTSNNILILIFIVFNIDAYGRRALKNRPALLKKINKSEFKDYLLKARGVIEITSSQIYLKFYDNLLNDLKLKA